MDLEEQLALLEELQNEFALQPPFYTIDQDATGHWYVTEPGGREIRESARGEPFATLSDAYAYTRAFVDLLP